MRTLARSAATVIVLAGLVFGAAACKGGDNKDTGSGASTPTAGGATSGGGAPVSTPTPKAGLPTADQLAVLQQYVKDGRLDEPVFNTMRDQGAVDALVVIDDDQVTETVKKLALARGIQLTDDKLVEMKAAAYAEIKKQVAAVAPEYAQIVTDFENFGVAQVRFTSADSMIRVLQQPQIAGIREIQEYKRDPQ